MNQEFSIPSSFTDEPANQPGPLFSPECPSNLCCALPIIQIRCVRPGQSFITIIIVTLLQGRQTGRQADRDEIRRDKRTQRWLVHCMVVGDGAVLGVQSVIFLKGCCSLLTFFIVNLKHKCTINGMEQLSRMDGRAQRWRWRNEKSFLQALLIFLESIL